MDKRQQLEGIIKEATLPPEVEKLILEEVTKQQEITDDFILTVADTLERLGIYFKTAGEVQDEYLDSVLEEARKVSGAMNVLDSITEQLEAEETEAPVQAPAETTQPQAEVPQPVQTETPPVQSPTQ